MSVASRTDAPSEARRAIFLGILLHMQEPHPISSGGVLQPLWIIFYRLFLRIAKAPRITTAMIVTVTPSIKLAGLATQDRASSLVRFGM